MKNAHERFGKLTYRRHTEKTATNLRVFLDAFVGDDRGKAHLVSVVGGDVEIGALLLLLPTVTHLPWSILTVKRASSRWARSRCASGAPSWFPAGNGR